MLGQFQRHGVQACKGAALRRDFGAPLVKARGIGALKEK
jgi:hypothetical protein